MRNFFFAFLCVTLRATLRYKKFSNAKNAKNYAEERQDFQK